MKIFENNDFSLRTGGGQQLIIGYEVYVVGALRIHFYKIRQNPPCPESNPAPPTQSPPLFHYANLNHVGVDDTIARAEEMYELLDREHGHKVKLLEILGQKAIGTRNVSRRHLTKALDMWILKCNIVLTLD